MKEQINFSKIEVPTVEIPTLVEKKFSGNSYISWGERNNYPSYLWGLYLRCSVLQSIINGTADYVCGDQIIFSDDIKRFQELPNKYDDVLYDIIKKCVIDYLIYGGFAVQIIKNKQGGIAEIYYIDIKRVRLSSDGKVAYYSDNWEGYHKNTITLPIYDGKADNSIFYFKGNITRDIYPVPLYIAAVESCEIHAQISDFHLHNILNNFEGSAIINFNNGVPTEEELRDIYKRINNMFSGSKNAGRTFVTFNEDKEKAVTVERLSEDKMDEKFKTLETSVNKNIFIAFRAIPQLFGYSLEGTAFNKQEFVEAFQLYNRTVVRAIQMDIKKAFDKIFGIKDSFIIKPFNIDNDEK